MKFRERMAEKLKLPKDLVMGAAVLTVTGRSEAYRVHGPADPPSDQNLPDDAVWGMSPY